MAATIRVLRSRKDRQRASTAARLVQVAREYEQLCLELRQEVPEDVRRHRAELEQEAAAEDGETFVMISIKQFDAVNDQLAGNSATPVVAMRLWAKIIGLLDKSTGEILAARAELAELVGTTPQEISRIMSELVRMNAIIRERRPANGPVRYFLNPRVGTHLAKEVRKLAQRDAPKLELVPVEKPKKRSQPAPVE
jgi:hypothetical protein